MFECSTKTGIVQRQDSDRPCHMAVSQKGLKRKSICIISEVLFERPAGRLVSRSDLSTKPQLAGRYCCRRPSVLLSRRLFSSEGLKSDRYTVGLHKQELRRPFCLSY